MPTGPGTVEANRTFAVSNTLAMRTRTSNSVFRLPVASLVLAAMAAAVGLAGTAFLNVSNALPADILAALRSIDPNAPPGWSMHVDTQPSGVGRGVQIGLACLFVGGAPAAMVAAALAKLGSRRGDGWKDDWDPVFFAGLIFQLSSLAFTGFLLAMLLWAALSVSDGIPDAAPFGGVLLVSVLCGAWGVHSWRTLQLQVRRASTRSLM